MPAPSFPASEYANYVIEDENGTEYMSKKNSSGRYVWVQLKSSKKKKPMVTLRSEPKKRRRKDASLVESNYLIIPSYTNYGINQGSVPFRHPEPIQLYQAYAQLTPSAPPLPNIPPAPPLPVSLPNISPIPSQLTRYRPPSPVISKPIRVSPIAIPQPRVVYRTPEQQRRPLYSNSQLLPSPITPSTAAPSAVESESTPVQLPRQLSRALSSLRSTSNNANSTTTNSLSVWRDLDPSLLQPVHGQNGQINPDWVQQLKNAYIFFETEFNRTTHPPIGAPSNSKEIARRNIVRLMNVLQNFAPEWLGKRQNLFK